MFKKIDVYGTNRKTGQYCYIHSTNWYRRCKDAKEATEIRFGKEYNNIEARFDRRAK